MVDSCWEVLVINGLLQAKQLKVLRVAGIRLSPLAGGKKDQRVGAKASRGGEDWIG